jgi:tape measure domain-containing protein
VWTWSTSTQSIKGIANLAALSGSNSQQASTAMYQLSQAIAAGRVGLQDWNSVVNAGMGGAVFQKALMRTAENMGTVAKGAVKIDKATGKATVNGESFRNSIMAKPGSGSPG